MGFWEDFFATLFSPLWGGIGDPKTIEELPFDPAIVDTAVAKAKWNRFLLAEGLVLFGAAFAPAAYAAMRKKKLKEKEIRTGIALENASVAATNTIVTALASPYIALPLAYITVQALEGTGRISKGLGNDIQGLLAISAAGPAIASMSGFATSAFTKGKK